MFGCANRSNHHFYIYFARITKCRTIQLPITDHLILGVIAFCFSFGLAALLAGMPLALRLAVFVPAWISALSLLQAHGST